MVINAPLWIAGFANEGWPIFKHDFCIGNREADLIIPEIFLDPEHKELKAISFRHINSKEHNFFGFLKTIDSGGPEADEVTNDELLADTLSLFCKERNDDKNSNYIVSEQ